MTITRTSLTTAVIRTSVTNEILRMGAFTSQSTTVAQSLDYSASLALTFLIAQTSVMYTFYQAGHIEGLRESGAFITELPYTLNGLHILISIGLVVCTIGLWSRRIIGLVISSLALVSVLATYGYWHFRTVKYLSEFRNDNQLYKRVQEEVGFFHGATRWDLAVVAIVVVLVLWHLVKLAKLITPVRK